MLNGSTLNHAEGSCTQFFLSFTVTSFICLCARQNMINFFGQSTFQTTDEVLVKKSMAFFEIPLLKEYWAGTSSLYQQIKHVTRVFCDKRCSLFTEPNKNLFVQLLALGMLAISSISSSILGLGLSFLPNTNRQIPRAHSILKKLKNNFYISYRFITYFIVANTPSVRNEMLFEETTLWINFSDIIGRTR